MFCTSCGGQIRDGAKFCIYCGAPQAKAKANADYPQEEAYGGGNQFEQVDGWAQEEDWTAPSTGVPEPAYQETEAAVTGLLVLQDVNNSDNVYACDLGSPAVLGRDAASCTMVVEGERSVSRRHCSFYRQGNACYVEDLKSFNHTLLNGVEIQEPTEIRVGDRLMLGALELVVAECDLSQ